MSSPSKIISAVTLRKRRKLTLSLAAVGLVIAVGFGIYLGINARSESPGVLRAAAISLVLCPGSLLFASFIDAEPWTNGFTFMWVATGAVNAAIYGVVGHMIGRLLWRSD